MSVMTEQQARRQMKAFRKGRGISCETLAAEMALVLGRATVTPKTLLRFEREQFHPHASTLRDINDFLTKRSDASASAA
jgi:hypothetical protein